MGSFGNYLENALLNHVFGCGSRNYIPPANIYVALSTADPKEDGSGLKEPVGNGYQRVKTGAADWETAVNGTLSNRNAIIFPVAGGDWGLITHFALLDAPTGGNLLAYGSLTLPKTLASGDTASFGVGDLTVSLD